MTQPEREKICAVLTGPLELPGETPKQRVIREVISTLAVAETYDLEPLIDEMLEQEFLRGRFAQLLEDADRILRQRRAAA